MLTIDVAGLHIGIDNRYPYLERQCRDYLGSKTPDFTVSATEAQLDEELRFGAHSRGYLESICVYREIARRLPDYGAFVMHAAVVEKDGVAYAFTAPSGTGKTTHLRLWLEQFPQAVTLNGDKPILRRMSRGFCACGTPWTGREKLGCNRIAPLGGICFLHRGEENKIRPVQGGQMLQEMMRQVYLPHQEELIDRLFPLLDELMTTVPLFTMECNMEPQAAQMSCTAMERVTAGAGT
ncbi:MAG: hypothetical protein PT958_00655 [Firmicutes bacterium]|nr:hypothetical protein [Bacillota bacterium]MDY2720683.1 hypothetical protein [Candidatus Faecousia sp.]